MPLEVHQKNAHKRLQTFIMPLAPSPFLKRNLQDPELVVYKNP